MCYIGPWERRGPLKYLCCPTQHEGTETVTSMSFLWRTSLGVGWSGSAYCFSHRICWGSHRAVCCVVFCRASQTGHLWGLRSRSSLPGPHSQDHSPPGPHLCPTCRGNSRKPPGRSSASTCRGSSSLRWGTGCALSWGTPKVSQSLGKEQDEATWGKGHGREGRRVLCVCCVPGAGTAAGCVSQRGPVAVP